MKAALLLVLLLAAGCAEVQPIGYGCGTVMAITNYGAALVDIDEPVGIWPDNVVLQLGRRPKLYQTVGVILWKDDSGTWVTAGQVAGCD